MANYPILSQLSETEEAPEGGYPMAKATLGTIRRLRALQVASSLYTDAERLEIAREMKWDHTGEGGWIESTAQAVQQRFTDDGAEQLLPIKDNAGKQVELTFLRPATLDAIAFRVEAAKVLFPTAPVARSADYLDAGAIDRALEDFLGEFRARSGMPPGR